MARTFRRRHEQHEYGWVLRDQDSRIVAGHWPRLNPKSGAGRKAIARFHADATVTMRSVAPRWYRKVSDHRIRTHDERMLRRWMNNPDFDPVFRVWHMHDANWSWW